MDSDRTVQLVSWLDEEHRKDKTQINGILAQLDKHLTQLTGLTRGLQDLEERLARVQSQSLRYSQIESALGQLKTEVTLLFDQFNERVQQREEAAFKVRQTDHERLDRAVADLNGKIDEVAAALRPFAPYGDAIKRVEGGQIAFVRGLEELNKRQEALNSRVAVTEEWVKRTGALIAEVQQLSDRLRQDRTDALDSMRRADQIRARQITEWNEQMKVARREMEDWVAQLRPLLDLPKETRAYLATLRELEDELKQIEPRLLQRQKLSEEFSRKEIDAIKVELERRWQQQNRDWEYVREEWSKKIAAIGTRFDPIDEWRPTVMEEFRQMREKLDADRQRFMSILSDVVRMQIEYERNANSRYEQFASDLVTRVDTEKSAAIAKAKRPPLPPARPEE